MIKHILYSAFLCHMLAVAQAPAGYYNNANGLTGFPLKTALSTIITNGYNEQSYGALLTLYQTSDVDIYYENDGTVLDMYSERPSAADAYNYTFSQNCGNFSAEGDCYNREHIYPQGFFNQLLPMRSDAHHVIPTDGWVNGGRSNFPFGIVGASPVLYTNGSKRGASITPGFNGTVFEPIDEFKGDIARALLYFATRYEVNFNDNGWEPHTAANDPRDGTANRFYEQWYINLLMDWHAADPVSSKEIDRNNAIFAFQNNRNPYVDNPQWVNMIWTNTSAPSGSIFATLNDTFIDVDNSGTATVGDQITYTYTISNIGSSTLFNVTATAARGTFANAGTLASLNVNQNVTNSFGTLTYTLVAADLAASCNCIFNSLTVNATFNAAGTNGSISIQSDDPGIFTNVDTNGDNLPDDPTRTNFPTGGGTSGTASELFISEYLEGSSNNKAIEIANFTGATVNLSAYSLQKDTNGGGIWTGSVALTGSLPNGQVYVVSRGNANAAILAQADLLVGNGLAMDFNGDDAVGLFKNGSLLDIVGVFGSSASFGANVTLVRKSSVTAPNTTFNLAAEWNSFGVDNTTDLGMHTFGNTASINDIATLNLKLYPNPSNGSFTIDGLESDMAIQVYDLAGRAVQTVRHGAQITNLNSGLYLIQITQAGLKIAVMRAVVQ